MNRTTTTRVSRFALASLLTVCAIFALGGSAHATTLELNGTADLTELSDTIVTGTVTQMEARMHPEHKFIYTYVTVEVDEVLKSRTVSANGTIVLEELGGRVGDWIHHVPAVPKFEVGERVLAFLEDRPDGYYRTYGMIQGKFRFSIHERTGEEVLTRPGEWTDVHFASSGQSRDLVAMRADGSFAAPKLLSAVRDWIATH